MIIQWLFRIDKLIIYLVWWWLMNEFILYEKFYKLIT
jgi:hypothetical protein